MKKYIKLIFICVLAIILPLVVFCLFAYYNLEILGSITAFILFAYPIYFPIFSGFFMIKLFKKANKILLPTIFYEILLSLLVLSSFLIIKLILPKYGSSISDDPYFTLSCMFSVLLLGALISLLTVLIVVICYRQKIEQTEIESPNPPELE